MEAAGAHVEVVAEAFGAVTSSDGREIEVDTTHVTAKSVMFDAVAVPAGADCASTLVGQGDSVQLVQKAFKHGKSIVALGDGRQLLRRAGLDEVAGADGVSETTGVVTAGDGAFSDAASRFVDAVAAHRHWDRARLDQIPA